MNPNTPPEGAPRFEHPNQISTAPPPAALFAAGLTLIFFILVFVGILNHEIWRDEAQAWLLARDSNSIPELLFNMRYEGHPPLWHFLLFAASRACRDPLTMQIIHLLVATAGIWLFARFAPFVWWQKVLFALGYFPLFEYALKSRCYALGILFLWAACATTGSRSVRYVLIFGALFFASISSIPAAIIAFAFSLFVFSSAGFRAALKNRGERPQAIIAILIFLGSCGITAFVVTVPPDTWHNWAPDYHFEITPARLTWAFGNISKAYLAMPSKASELIPSPDLFNELAAACLLGYCAVLFLSRPRVLAFYLAATSGLLALFYVKYADAWHRGHLFITLIMALWLIRVEMPSMKMPRLIHAASRVAERLLPALLPIILGFQLVNGYAAFRNDLARPFSSARQVAAFIREEGLASLPVLGSGCAFLSPVVAYLDTPAFVPATLRRSTYCLWNRERTSHTITVDTLLGDATTISRRSGSGVILVLHGFTIPPGTRQDIHLLTRFEGSITGEDYSLFLLTYQPSPSRERPPLRP